MNIACGIKAIKIKFGNYDKNDKDKKALKIMRWDDDKLVINVFSILRKKVDIVEKVDDIEEKEMQEEGKVKGTIEIEDQSKDKYIE